MSGARDVLISGIGLVTALAADRTGHLDLLAGGAPLPDRLDTARFSPYGVFPLAPIELDRQIPKKADQRQMEAWQRIGTYAAGLALADAGIAGDKDLLSRTDMIVAAGGGERDAEVDAAALGDLAASAPAERGAKLNQRLTNDLRPTLFLAQLPNLLAGNISIVHGVTGSSRSFMGEESAGVDAVRVTAARIAAGQSEIALVGGSFNAERPDLMLLHAFDHGLRRAPFGPVWDGRGMVLGSIGAFLVLEARRHAEARGATPVARLAGIASMLGPRAPGATATALEALWSKVGIADGADLAVVSGATGLEAATAEEAQVLARLVPRAALRATGSVLGHGIEAQFPANLALGALILAAGRAPPPLGAPEKAHDAPIRRAAVTSIGHWRGEGLALLTAA